MNNTYEKIRELFYFGSVVMFFIKYIKKSIFFKKKEKINFLFFRKNMLKIKKYIYKYIFLFMDKFIKYYSKSSLLEFKLLNFISSNYSSYNINPTILLNFILKSKNPKFIINILNLNSKKLLLINHSILSSIIFNTKNNLLINSNSINLLSSFI